MKAEAAGHLTNESIFYIDIKLDQALIYDVEGLASSVESLASTSFSLAISDLVAPTVNASEELRVTDGKISPVSATTNETGIINVRFTAPELAENETEKKVEIIIKISKPGYEDGRYTEEVTVVPIAVVDGKKDEGTDVVMVALVVIIIVLIVLIVLGLKVKGKRYW